MFPFPLFSKRIILREIDFDASKNKKLARHLLQLYYFGGTISKENHSPGNESIQEKKNKIL